MKKVKNVDKVVKHKYSVGGTPMVKEIEVKATAIADIFFDDEVTIEANGFGIFSDNVANALKNKYPRLDVEDYVPKEPKAKKVVPKAEKAVSKAVKLSVPKQKYVKSKR